MKTSYKFFEETDVPEGELIISRTDFNGNITFANELFASISGYSVDELVGKPHSIVRHPDMPKSVFKDLWETLKRGELWSGYVKNMRKDGGYYWVYAEVSAMQKDNKLVGYKSMRSPIDKETKKAYQDKYDNLRKEEEKSCRIVSNISVDNLNKLTALAKEEGIREDKILDYILSDSLL
jgi:aerotaxis receptor